MSFGRNPSGGQVKDEATYNAFAVIERDMVEIDNRIKSLEPFRGNLANEIDRAVDVLDSTKVEIVDVRDNLIAVLRNISLNVKKL